MPGFFEGMKRMIQGKPVFDENDPMQGETPRQPSQQPAGTSAGGIQKYHDESFPVVYIKRAITRFNGNRMEVYCYVVNTWQGEVLIDKIRIFDTKREIDATLRPNQEREFLVYSGPKITRDISEAFLDYKTLAENDYFEAIHDVRYNYHSDDKTYEVNDIRLRKPIRDIYG